MCSKIHQNKVQYLNWIKSNDQNALIILCWLTITCPTTITITVHVYIEVNE